MKIRNGYFVQFYCTIAHLIFLILFLATTKYYEITVSTHLTRNIINICQVKPCRISLWKILIPENMKVSQTLMWKKCEHVL